MTYRIVSWHRDRIVDHFQEERRAALPKYRPPPPPAAPAAPPPQPMEQPPVPAAAAASGMVSMLQPMPAQPATALSIAPQV